MNAQQMRYITPWQAAQVRRERLSRGQTVQQFAAALRVSDSTVYLIERGAKRIRWDVAETLRPFLERRQ